MSIHLLISGKAGLIHDQDADRLNAIVRHCRISRVTLKAVS
ncbi:hypothetical protein [Agrobacterium tumefaciens]|nr:hypothetical protein [Agrobacterium tumefaciens]